MRRGIVYAPDYAINAGGVINIYHEARGRGRLQQAARVRRRSRGSKRRSPQILKRARPRTPPDVRRGRPDRRRARREGRKPLMRMTASARQIRLDFRRVVTRGREAGSASPAGREARSVASARRGRAPDRSRKPQHRLRELPSDLGSLRRRSRQDRSAHPGSRRAAGQAAQSGHRLGRNAHRPRGARSARSFRSTKSRQSRRSDRDARFALAHAA